MSWYLIKTRSKCTLKANDYFNRLEVKNYIPVRRSITTQNKIKITPLFPGYVFIKLPFKLDYDLINLNPYTTDVIRKNSTPIVIPDDQMDIMIKHVDSIYNNNDFKTYNSGDHISIEYGTLEGLKGQVIEVKNNKIYIQIDGLSAKVSIEYNG